MSSIQLIFQANPQTQIPQLQCATQTLPAHVRDGWEQELRSQYRELQTGRKTQFRFQQKFSGWPQMFDVAVEGDGDPRMRTLILTARDERPRQTRPRLPSIEPPSPEPVPPPPPVAQPTPWRQEFLNELDCFAGQLEEVGHLRLGLTMVLSELRQLADEHPQTLSLVLLAGYLHVAERMCEQRGDLQRLCYYVATCQILAQACDVEIPTEVLPQPGLNLADSPMASVAQALYRRLWQLLNGEP